MIGYDKERKTYFVQYQVKDPLTGKWSTKKKRGFKLKRDAAQYEASVKIEKTNTAPKITFLEMNDLYEKSFQISSGQSQQRHTHFERRFPLKDNDIRKITRLQLETWRTELISDETYATRTKNKTIAYVKSVFKFAYDVYGIPNIAQFLRSAKYTDSEIMSQERPVWTPDQYKKFIDCVELPIYKIFFDFLFWTGCRRGEAMALQKSDVHGNHAFIHYSIKHFKNGLKPTKTRTSRTIVLDDTLAKEIEPLMSTEGDFVFGGERSLSISAIQSQFTKAKKKAGIQDNVTIHCLRHSHATWLINNGVNIVAVSKRLGHADIETTLKTYAHLLKDTDSSMMEFINKCHKQ